MNKTININLGGYFFHIDETAYQKLRKYLDAIARSLSDDPHGKNEIIADIEARISELLSEKITDERQVVNEQDINDIIKIMGQPEDYADEEETHTSASYSYNRNTNSKKLFRDGENKFLGGVASGLAHYFNIDIIWIRLAFLLFLFTGGFSVLLYIVLWVLLPEAKTTAEKLQMEGEPVNIDNIEKKIREEFTHIKETVKEGAENVSEKFSNADYKEYAQKTKSGFQDFLDSLGKILVSIFKVFGKFIGIIIIITSASVLVSLIIALFSVGSMEILGFEEEFHNLPFFLESTVLPKWLLLTSGILIVAIPFLVLFVLGLRILSSNLKQFSKTTSYTLLGVWIVALFLLIFTGVETSRHKAYDGNFIENKEVSIASDTIELKMANDDNLYYLDSDRFWRRDNKEIVEQDGVEKIYSNYVKVNVEKTDEAIPFLKIRKRSEGSNKSKANKSAMDLEYRYTISDNKINLNAYFLSHTNGKYKREIIYATLYLPEGKTVYLNKNIVVTATPSLYD